VKGIPKYSGQTSVKAYDIIDIKKVSRYGFGKEFLQDCGLYRYLGICCTYWVKLELTIWNIIVPFITHVF